MSYLGKGLSSYEAQVALRTDVFSANGTGNTFILSYSVGSPQDIEVIVNNTQLSPFNGSYTVSGGTLTLSTAPSAGANNVYVIFRDYFQVATPLNNQSVITDYIASQAVTTPKLGNHSVTSVKLANTLSMGSVTMTGPSSSTNTFSVNTRASSANHATQKQYVDALTIVFGA